MGKIIETKINSFGGGIVSDARDPREGTARMVTGFDIVTNPRKMTPYRDSESADSAPTTSKKQNFCIGLWTATNPDEWRLFALGVVSGTARAEVLMKTLDIASTGLGGTGWLTPNGNQSSAGSANFEMFIYYKRTGKIYGMRADRYVWEFTPDGATAWDDSKYDYGSTCSNISQAIIHSKDDNMYFGIDNVIIKNSNGTFSTPLSLPSHLKIMSVSEYGNYLMIACAPISGVGSSIGYLWDRDSSLTTLSESIDWGEGELKVIEQVQGEVIGISISGNSTTRFGERIIFRHYNGGTVAQEIATFIPSSAGTNALKIAKQKINNRLYFMMRAYLNGAQRDGVWSVGRDTRTGQYTIIHERTPENDTALTSSPQLNNFIFVGDFLFQSYQTGGNYALSSTNDSASYATTGIYESKKFDAGDASLKKDLIGVTVMHEALPTAGQVVLKYRKDEETSFTTILTNTTDNSISKSAVNIESTGGALPKDYKEIELRLESTGGAEITGYSFKEEITDKKPYG